jgi:predicted TIM-barrel fold metal-dependent hydrolase
VTVGLRHDPATSDFRAMAELDTWLARQSEPVLEPELPIIDPHQHFWRRALGDYLPDALLADAAGQRVIGTVFIECRTAHRQTGPDAMRPVGETDFVVETTAGAPPWLAAGVVGFADLTLGPRVRPVLEAQIAAGRGRFRGIRHPLRWEATGIGMYGRQHPAGLALDLDFRRGFAELAPLGLSFDAWLFHTQLGELLDLARAFPETTIIVNHGGGPLGVGRHAGRRQEIFGLWRERIAALAACPNLVMKVGGFGMLYAGFDFHAATAPPDSAALAVAWRPYVETCLEHFGPGRCMFESNFPVDRQSCNYRALWNAFKRLTAGLPAEERAALFHGTAARVYRLEEAAPG